MSQVRTRFIQALGNIGHAALGTVAVHQMERNPRKRKKKSGNCTPCEALARMEYTRALAKQGRIL